MIKCHKKGKCDFKDKKGNCTQPQIALENCFKQHKKKYNPKKDLYNAEHPARRKAIYIMETISEKVGKPTLFDCQKNDDTRWYDIEDFITRVIAGK